MSDDAGVPDAPVEQAQNQEQNQEQSAEIILIEAQAKHIAELQAELAAVQAVQAAQPAHAAEVDLSLAALDAAGVGSVFEKTASGWNVKYVDGGTVIYVQGATIADAIASHGAQVEHAPPRDPEQVQLAREQLAREAAVALTVQ